MNKKQIQLQYNLLQGLFWMLFCITISFINSYLTGKGLSPDQIGIITATFGALAALSQTVLGRIADSSKTINWKNLIVTMIVLRILANFGILLVDDALISGLLFGLSLLLMNALIPFVNAANFYYEKNGINLNYGVARGIGSLLFAVTSYSIGQLIPVMGLEVIVIAGFIIGFLMLLITISMPLSKKEEDIIIHQQVNASSESFFKKYPKFVMLLVGFTLLMVFHNSTSTYMLQILENVGGGNKELGTAFAIAAIFELPIMFGFVYLRKKFSTHQMLIVAGFAFIGKALVYIISSSVGMIYVAQALQMLSFGLFASASVYCAEEEMDLNDKVKGQSLAAGSITIGSVFGNLSGGFIVNSFGSDANLLFGLGVVILATVIIILAKKK
ncbi:MAG: MFS transporter [Tissierellia bacterium]|nr:MFS transporter [Tissierellia bacterium]